MSSTTRDTVPSSTDRVAIVTGGSRGIGAALCARLARDGFATVVNYAGSTEAAESVVADIEAAGGRALAFQADIADPAAVAALFDAATEAFGGVDVLVNNGGIMQLATLAESDDTLFDRTVAVNLKGTFNGLREAARRLRGGGSVVSLSSSVVALKLETYAVYAATKAAVEAMTPILAKEMRGRDITVNAVAPGPTGTALFLDGKPDALIEKMARMNPIERLGTPGDIAACVSFLAGPDGRWVNGQVLRANGGVI